MNNHARVKLKDLNNKLTIRFIPYIAFIKPIIVTVKLIKKKENKTSASNGGRANKKTFTTYEFALLKQYHKKEKHIRKRKQPKRVTIISTKKWLIGKIETINGYKYLLTNKY